RCVELLPSGGWLFNIGVMLARRSAGLRLVLPRLGMAKIVSFLRAIGWPGQPEALFSLVSPAAEDADPPCPHLGLWSPVLPRARRDGTHRLGWAAHRRRAGGSGSVPAGEAGRPAPGAGLLLRYSRRAVPAGAQDQPRKGGLRARGSPRGESVPESRAAAPAGS